MRVTSGRESAWIHARATTGLVVSATFLYRFAREILEVDVAGQDSWFAEVSFGTDTIVRHGNVWSGGNEGERWQIVRTTLFFSFSKVRQGCATFFFSVVSSPATLSCPDADAGIATMSVAVGVEPVRDCLYCRLWLFRLCLFESFPESSLSWPCDLVWSPCWFRTKKTCTCRHVCGDG